MILSYYPIILLSYYHDHHHHHHHHHYIVMLICFLFLYNLQNSSISAGKSRTHEAWIALPSLDPQALPFQIDQRSWMPSCDGLEVEILMSLVIGQELDPPKMNGFLQKERLWDDGIPFQKTGDVKGSICEISRVYFWAFWKLLQDYGKKTNRI